MAVIAMIYFNTAGAPKRAEEDNEEDDEPLMPPPRPKKQKAAKRPPPSPMQTLAKTNTPLRSSQGVADEKFAFRSSMEGFRQESAVEDRVFTTRLKPGELLVSEDLRVLQSEGAVYKRKKHIPIASLLQAMPKKSTIVVAREVLDLPVAFRKTPFPRDV